MSRIFQITGYPRSGTAWLTTMFNLAPEVMAYHELAMTDGNWRQTLQEQSTVQIVGDIGTYQYFPKAVIAQSQKIFIRRDPEISQLRVEKSTGVNLPNNAHSMWERMVGNWISEWTPFEFEFRDVFSIQNLEHIWYLCLPLDIRFPTKKVEQLLKFNIQLHEPAKALSDPGAITRLAELL